MMKLTASKTVLSLAVVAALVLAALSIRGTLALVTDTASVPGNTFTTAAVFSPPWWDASYGYRQRITVTTGPNSPFNGYNGYSVQLFTNTASLIGAGNLQADCDDLRVVFWNLSLWTELDRDLYSCNAASTEVWFQLQADIAANSTVSRYYLYYGNPAAAGPPANRSNVYLHYNGWSTDRLAEYAVGRQDSWHGTGTYTGFTWDSINQRVNFDTGDNFTGGLRLASFGERDVYIEQTVAYTGCYPSNVTQGPMARYSGDGTSSDNWYAFVQANSTGCTPGAYTNPAMQKDNRTSAGFCGSGSGAAWVLDGATHRQGFAIWGVNSTNLKGWLDKTARRPTEAADLSCSDASDHENTGDVAWMQAQSAGSFDDFLVRRYTEPEPTMSLGTEESWWDTSYAFRQKITVSASTAAVTSGYSVGVTFDHAALVTASKSQADGDDVRVVYWNGSSWVQLDRVLDEDSAWNNTGTEVWFKLQAGIGAGASDDNYYLYYGNPAATSPPADKSNVYALWDDFDDGLLDPGWSLDAIGSVSGGSTNESGTVVRVTATSSGDIWGASDNAYHLARSITGDFLAESYTTAIGGTHHQWSKYGGVHLRDTSSANSKNRNMSEVYTAAGSTNSYRLATGGSTAEQLGQRYDYNRLTRVGGTSRAFNSSDGIVWNEIGNTISFTGGLPDPVRVGPILAAISSTDHWVEVDWFKIRLYVEPEPTTSPGAEEPAP